MDGHYLKELVRFIHLNPFRARFVANYKSLKGFGYAGHSALMGQCPRQWQNTEYILSLFGRNTSVARRSYSEFVERGISDGERPELVGGGLIRSLGGRYPETVEARSVLCYWAARELGLTTLELSKRLRISQPTASQSVKRGEKIVKDKGLKLIE